MDSSAASFELSNHLKKAGGNFMRYMDLSINMLAQVMRKEGKDLMKGKQRLYLQVGVIDILRLFGNNTDQKYLTLEELTNRYENMLTDVRSLNQNIYIILGAVLPVVSLQYSAEVNKFVNQLNSMIRYIASKNEKVVFAPVAKLFKREGKPYVSLFEDVFPNKYGFQLLADGVRRATSWPEIFDALCSSQRQKLKEKSVREQVEFTIKNVF